MRFEMRQAAGRKTETRLPVGTHARQEEDDISIGIIISCHAYMYVNVKWYTDRQA